MLNTYACVNVHINSQLFVLSTFFRLFLNKLKHDNMKMHLVNQSAKGIFYFTVHNQLIAENEIQQKLTLYWFWTKEHNALKKNNNGGIVSV